MAERRVPNRLKEGTRWIDYSNPSRILEAFDNDMSAIRAEYSRHRSIIRKRLNRLEAEGETYNPFYLRYGQNREEAIPALKGLSDKDVLDLLSSTATAIAGGYHFTVSDIQESRKDIIDTLKAEAEQANDPEFASSLDNDPTAEDLAHIGSIMGMIQKVVGRLVESKVLRQMALKLVMNKKDEESLRTKAEKIIRQLGLDDTDKKINVLKEMFDENGKKNPDYIDFSKVRRKRG